MFCLKCGKVIEDNAVFCPFCGSKQPKASWLEPQQQQDAHGHEEIPQRMQEQEAPQPEALWQRAQETVQAVPLHAGETKHAAKTGLTETATGVIGPGLLLPLLFTVIAFAVRIVFGILPLPGTVRSVLMPVGRVLKQAIPFVIYLLIAVLAILLIIGLIILLVKRSSAPEGGTKPSSAMPVTGIIVCCLVLPAAVLGLIGIFSPSVVLTVIRVVLTILALIPGLYLALKVFGLKEGLTGAFHPIADIKALGEHGKRAHAVDPAMYTSGDIPANELTPQIEANDSFFDGKGLTYFGKGLLFTLIVSVTCGIAYPWAQVMLLKWQIGHTVIEGKRQSFNGTGGQLFLECLKWFFLTLITLGFYGFYFVPVNYRKWVTSHTTYAGLENGTKEAYADSYFDGAGPEYFGYGSFSSLLSIITCLIGYPWAVSFRLRWEKRCTVIARNRYFYDGSGMGLLGTYLLCGLLSVITCGIYVPWAYCRIMRYLTNHTHIDATRAG